MSGKIYLSSESIEFLKNNKEGKIDDLPDELKSMMIGNVKKMKDLIKNRKIITDTSDKKVTFRNKSDAINENDQISDTYNFDGNTDDINVGVKLVNSYDDVFTVTDIFAGEDRMFIDTDELADSIVILYSHDIRFDTIKIKDTE